MNPSHIVIFVVLCVVIGCQYDCINKKETSIRCYEKLCKKYENQLIEKGKEIDLLEYKWTCFCRTEKNKAIST